MKPLMARRQYAPRFKLFKRGQKALFPSMRNFPVLEKGKDQFATSGLPFTCPLPREEEVAKEEDGFTFLIHLEAQTVFVEGPWCTSVLVIL